MTRLSGHRSLKIENTLMGLPRTPSWRWSCDADLDRDHRVDDRRSMGGADGARAGRTYIPLIFLTRTYLAESLGGLMFVGVMLAGLLTYRRLSRGSARPLATLAPGRPTPTAESARPDRLR